MAMYTAASRFTSPAASRHTCTHALGVVSSLASCLKKDGRRHKLLCSLPYAVGDPTCGHARQYLEANSGFSTAAVKCMQAMRPYPGGPPRCYPAAYSFFFYICKQGCSVLADPGSEEVFDGCRSFVQCRAGEINYLSGVAIVLRGFTWTLYDSLSRPG